MSDTVKARVKQGKSFNLRIEPEKEGGKSEYEMKTEESEPFEVEARYLTSFPDVLEEVEAPKPAPKAAPKGAAPKAAPAQQA